MSRRAADVNSVRPLPHIYSIIACFSECLALRFMPHAGRRMTMHDATHLLKNYWEQDESIRYLVHLYVTISGR